MKFGTAQLVKLVRRIEKKHRKLHLVMEELGRHGFKYLSEGCYKAVYEHPKRPEWVVKVYKDDYGWEYDSNKPPPKPLKKHWLKPIFQNKRVMIQRKVDKTDRGAASDQLREIAAKHYKCRNFDLHAANCAFVDGKPMFFDYLS